MDSKTINDNYAIQKLTDELNDLKTSLMSLTQEVSMLKAGFKNQRKRALYEKNNPYNF